MSLSSLFYGMEAYLDGDIEINNNISTPEDDEAMADQSAEVASDLADAQNDDKDTEIQAGMFVKMFDLCAHVKKYGIDRTFLSIYGSHGELDRVCNMQFPSLESMVTVGDPYSKYSTAFIAAMEDGNETWWQWIKRKAQEFWEWIKEKANKIWTAIKGFFDFLTKKWHKIADYFKKNKNAGSNSPDAKDCADDAKTATEYLRVTKENNDKAAEAASKAGEEVTKAAKKAAAAENGSEEQKAAVEETKAKAEELNKQVQKIEAQAEQQRRNQEALNKRMAESTVRNNKRREEERKKKEEADKATAQKEWVAGQQQAGSGELALQVLDYLSARDLVLNNSASKTQLTYVTLHLTIETMLNTIKQFETVGFTEDGKKIATVLLQAAGKLKNVQSLILNGTHQCTGIDKKIIERVERILRSDKRVTNFTTTAKEVLRNSKESGIGNTVNTYRNNAEDKNHFDSLLQ